MTTTPSTYVSYLAWDGASVLGRVNLSPEEAAAHQGTLLLSGYIFQAFVHGRPIQENQLINHLSMATAFQWSATGEFQIVPAEGINAAQRVPA